MNKHQLFFKSLSGIFRRKIKEQEALGEITELTAKLERIAVNCSQNAFSKSQIEKIESLIEENVLCRPGDLIHWRHQVNLALKTKSGFQELWRS